MAYSSITKPSDYFNTVLYTGNGSSGHAITGVGFRPDFNWIKNRGATNSHIIHDVLRGVGYELQSNTTAAQGTADPFTSFDSDGFTLGGGGGGINGNSETYVSWNWKANGSGSANTDGSINTISTSVNTTAGFSICKWAGSGSNATIGHGLGVAPKMVITKSLSSSAWGVYHASLGNTKVLFLDTTAGESANVAYWNNTSPTSTVFSVGTDSAVNHSGNDMIAYCFAEKTGYSKFGSYVGNNNQDGPFIYTGFKPAFVIAKNATSSGYSWELFDNKRNLTDGVGNVIQKRLFPDSNAVEGGSASTDYIDFLSNGFKIRKAGDSNENNSTYIFMAFAEEPLVANSGTDGVPATAR